MIRFRLISISAVCGLPLSGALAQPCGNPWSAGAMGPSPQYRHAASYDSTRGKVVVFGVVPNSVPPLGETWEWTAAGPGGGGSWTLRPETGPGGRFGAGMAYDSDRHRIVLFGGVVPGSPATYTNQTWEWDGSAWTLMSPAVSPAVASDSSLMAYDSARQSTVLILNSGPSGQTWEYSGTTWAAQPDAAPNTGESYRFTMAYDASRSRMALFGPVLATGSFGGIGVWERGPSGWTLVQQDTLPYRYETPPRAGYDSASGRILVLDMHDISGATRVWAWNGPQNGWSILSGAGPVPLALGSATYDAAGAQLVTVGGYPVFSGPPSGRVDLYRPSVRSGPELSNLGVREVRLDLGGPPVTFSVSAAGSGTISYQWRLNGVPLSDGGGFSGTTTPNLTIDPNDGAHSGYYDAVVTDDCGSSLRPTTYALISCYVNCDGSSVMPILNAEDFQCFLNMYASALGLPIAQQLGSYGNCDLSTSPPVLNVNDFQCFLNKYAVGCP